MPINHQAIGGSGGDVGQGKGGRRTSCRKKLYSASLEPSIPAALARPATFSYTVTRSLFCSRLGTSYVLSRLERSSTKVSFLIWVSANRKTTFLLDSPAILRTFLMSSCQSGMPYVLLISMLNTSYSSMKAASRLRLLRPRPPMPTSRALPPGLVMMRAMRLMCSSAYVNSTRFIGFLLVALWSLRYSLHMATIVECSFTSVYSLGS